MIKYNNNQRSKYEKYKSIFIDYRSEFNIS
jgi:hypothetical protein